jgi:Cu2+-exporting ATPase
VDGERYRIGRRKFVRGLFASHEAADTASDDILVYLGDSNRELAAFRLGDRLRSEAPQVVAALQSRDITCEILSGDAWVAVAQTAKACGVSQFTARQTPSSKLDYVRESIASGARVAMIGDGVNDAPVLKGANVSLAMGRASALAQVSADIVLIGDNLRALPDAIDMARRVQRVVKQNLTWATLYNLLALPLAAFGFVPPRLAAIGMSASSIIVVLNSLRLSPSLDTAHRVHTSIPTHHSSHFTHHNSNVHRLSSRPGYSAARWRGVLGIFLGGRRRTIRRFGNTGVGCVERRCGNREQLQ